jgi:hypothetical protein
MNGKRLLLLAVFGAIATFAAPRAFAGTTAQNANITVEWNAQPITSMYLETNYNNALAYNAVTQSASAPSVLASVSGTGACTATGGGVEANNVTANFGNVTPDSASNTDCLYKNALNIGYSTTDSSYTVDLQLISGSSTFPAGTTYGTTVNLCYYKNGTWPTAQSQISSRSSGVGQLAPGTCTGGSSITTSAAAIYTGTALSTGSNLGMDIDLQMAANAPSGPSSAVVQASLIDN